MKYTGKEFLYPSKIQQTLQVETLLFEKSATEHLQKGSFWNQSHVMELLLYCKHCTDRAKCLRHLQGSKVRELKEIAVKYLKITNYKIRWSGHKSSRRDPVD